MVGIRHTPSTPGTDISKSANYGADHTIDAGVIGSTELADGSVTFGKLATNMRFYRYVVSGTSPITFNHLIGQAPTGVVATPKAVQPYTWAYDTTATQIKIYHNAVGSLTFSVIAWVTNYP